MTAGSPYVLGLDLALCTGFALLDKGGDVVTYGHWSSKAPREGKKVEDRSIRDQVRFHTFSTKLEDLLKLGGRSLKFVAYEWVWDHTSTAQTQLYGGWRGITLAHSQACRRTVIPVANVTLRSVATGGVTPESVKAVPKGKGSAKQRRNAWKQAVITAAREQWDLPAELTDDEADALWVAEAARRVAI